MFISQKAADDKAEGKGEEEEEEKTKGEQSETKQKEETREETAGDVRHMEQGQEQNESIEKEEMKHDAVKKEDDEDVSHTSQQESKEKEEKEDDIMQLVHHSERQTMKPKVKPWITQLKQELLSKHVGKDQIELVDSICQSYPSTEDGVLTVPNPHPHAGGVSAPREYRIAFRDQLLQCVGPCKTPAQCSAAVERYILQSEPDLMTAALYVSPSC